MNRTGSGSPARSAPEADEVAEGADLRHVDTWVFDLDNTLYPPEAGVLDRVEAKIRDYFVELTGLPPDEAWELQRRYFLEDGSAVPGLVRRHGVDPREFLFRAHDVDLSDLDEDPALRAALDRLPGRRLVFTNGSALHAERVLGRLGVRDLFDDVFHVEAADFIAKPDPRAFSALMRIHGVRPETTAFFEDRLVNLKPAFDLGMTTVLVGGSAGSAPAKPPGPEPFVRHHAADLTAFLNSARLMEV